MFLRVLALPVDLSLIRLSTYWPAHAIVVNYVWLIMYSTDSGPSVS